MKIARFSHSGAINFGLLDDDALVVLDGDPMYAGFDTTGERVPLAEATLLAPVIPRSKIVAIGKNYHDHAAEMGGTAPEEPLLFLKPNTAVVGPHDRIVLPPQSRQVEHEGELAVVIGSVAKERASIGCRERDLRLHDRERRHRARPAACRRPVVPREGVSTRSARSVPSSRRSSRRTRPSSRRA